MSNEIIFFITIAAEFLAILLALRFSRAALIATIVLNIVLVTVFGSKLISLFGFTTNAANVFYASIFLAANILTEHHGAKFARKAIWIGFFGLVLFVAMGQVSMALIGLSDSAAANQAISSLFALVPRIALASVTAYVFAQHFNIWMYSLLKKSEDDKSLWVRNLLPQFLAEIIDSLLFFSIAFWRILPLEVIGQSMFIGLVAKMIVAIFSTPILYLSFVIKPETEYLPASNVIPVSSELSIDTKPAKAKSFGFAFLVFFFLVLATFSGWYYARQANVREVRQNLNNQLAENKRAIQTHLDLYTDTLISAKALFAASNSVERNEFNAYFKNYNIFQLFPGISGISFTQRVKLADKEQFIKTVRQDSTMQPGGYPNFDIHPSGERSDYYVLLYSEPNSNLASSTSFGLDFASNPDRFAALQTARDSGKPALTTPTASLGSSTQTTFLIFEPVYKNSAAVGTEAERRDAFFGTINGVFQAKTFFNSISEASTSPLGFQLVVYDTQKTPSNILFEGTNNLNGSAEYSQEMTLEVAGRTWHIFGEAASDFGLSRAEKETPIVILIVGLLASILIFSVLFASANARFKATAIAQEMNKALSNSEEKYRSIFESLQDVFYRTDLSGKILIVSPSIVKFIGIPPEQLIGRSASEFYTDPKQREEMLAKVQKEGSVNDYMLSLHGPDGKPIEVSLNAKLLFDDNHKPMGIEGVLRDISERKKSETELAKRTEELQRFNKLMVDRELKMIELKKEIDNLKKGFPANEQK